MKSNELSDKKQGQDAYSLWPNFKKYTAYLNYSFSPLC